MKIYNCFYEIAIKSLRFTIPTWVQILRRNYVILTLLLALNFIAATPAMAANKSFDLLKQPATEITINLGNAANELKFEPNHLEFEVGKRYQLQLNNPSQLKHYFTAKDFADGIWTQKVEAGKVEIKGAIHELELKPDAEAEWVFVPLKSGTYGLRCTIPGHTEAGMTGEIAIKN
ncbi:MULTISPECIES: plastocyanin/azurin family copper-binding protein [unclassified Nostoc]|uniref:plastocyanin/azurin family copper-binding protein n=1 Tax=unclassified Nostoc TaxID=2593658 RepID=UPI0025AB5180|nr:MULTISPECIES: plastocyanin/azurin family copper-binding protein [unclassified Nostoc]MDM9581780.1 cupredoxin domain-containing protein [Nostoc sp. GT001]MDZ7946901.1 cupredoxin domain-containing protein [Nostoc sp. EfeVER01]MDZ7995682.1 cupredoxin domain-containing protein [Nostoc sp. EspVER01]